MFSTAQRLRKIGVLGLNERNANFIMQFNPRRLFPRVDDKVLTKELAVAAGMAVPDLYGVIVHQAEVRNFSPTRSACAVVAKRVKADAATRGSS